MRPGLEAKRLVIKVGSAVLAGPKGLEGEVMAEIARQVLALRQEGREVVLVSSGAVAAGMAALGIPRPQDMPTKQALAAIGQPLLMAHWREAFAPNPVAQVLLTAEDLASRERYLNAKATLQALLGLGALPIINEKRHRGLPGDPFRGQRSAFRPGGGLGGGGAIGAPFRRGRPL